MAENELLTFTDAGLVVGVSHSTISKWVAAGYLASVQMPGSTRRRVRKQTLLNFIAKLESESFATSATSESLPRER